jgi:tetratricopeptide (TPR) repeat protein
MGLSTMTLDKNLKPTDLYAKYLSIINGIKFTPREIDIISCIVAGKTPQSIASFLSTHNKKLELQTVNTHIVNIRRKIDGNARAQILEFIEKSDKHQIIHHYYLSLMIQKIFIESVEKLTSQISKYITKIYLIDERSNSKNNELLLSLQSYCNIANIHSTITERSSSSTHDLTSSEFIIHLSESDKINQYDHIKNTPMSEQHLFLLDDEPAEDMNNLKQIKLKNYPNHYHLFLNIINKICPSLEENIAPIELTLVTKELTLFDKEQIRETKSQTLKTDSNHKPRSLNKKTLYVTTLLVILASIINGIFLYNKHTSSPNLSLLHSDLMIPVPSVLLQRDSILQTIDNNFHNNRNIQTIALIGQGGAGKTTIARLYAAKQTTDLVWEINAETKITLIESFVKLAEGLAQTESDQELLQEIKAIQTPNERINKIILFVKQRLILYPNWFLIFDNVDNIHEVQKYIPHDHHVCGYGRIIITTRDSNITAHKYINHTIAIGELTPEQKTSLFSKIISDKAFNPEHISNLLNNIPPFPLDVSIAAYYIKATDTSCAQYIIDLNNNSNDFDNIQSLLLNETGDYNQTRYKIITLSLEHLISSHQDFKDLLLFIAMLDSQNIPRNLLDRYKNHVVVDSFIYNLKKYSLISGESLTPLGEVFNLHRSTQAISLAYLTQKFDLEHNQKQFINPIGKIFRSYVSDLVDNEDSPKIRLMLPHSKTFLMHTNLLTEETKILVENAIGYIYYYLGFDLKSKQHLEISLQKLQKYYGTDHIDPARTTLFLAMAIRRIGDYKEAKRLLIQSMNISKKYPEYHMQHARSLACLGLIHRLLGEYKEAIAMFLESAKIAKEHPDNQVGIGRSFTNLSEAYAAIGLHDKALQSINELMPLYTDFDKDNIETIWVLNPLGVSYATIGKYNEAQPILERSLKLTEQHFGKEHIQTAWTLLHLGINNLKLGEYKTARELLTRSRIIHERNFGNNHTQTSWSIIRLGEVELLQNNFSEAEKLIIPTLEILRTHNAPARHKALELLGDLYIKKIAYLSSNITESELKTYKQKALNCYEEALLIITTHFPKDSVYLKELHNKIAKITSIPSSSSSDKRL